MTSDPYQLGYGGLLSVIHQGSQTSASARAFQREVERAQFENPFRVSFDGDVIRARPARCQWCKGPRSGREGPCSGCGGVTP